MKFLAPLCLLLVSVLHAGPFATSRVQAGRFVYRDTRDGKVLGTFTLTITPQADGTTIFTGDAEGFHQHWRAATTADFTPIYAELRIRRNDQRTYAMDVRYEAGIARGSVTNAPAPTKSSERAVPADTVDQRLDWAAMLSSPLDVGERVHFHVYDPDAGLTAVSGQALAAQTVTVPAGTYSALRLQYRMDKSAEPETYVIDVTQTAPRFMVREEFPDGSVTELIEATFFEARAK